MEIMRWCLPAQKIGFNYILNVLFGIYKGLGAYYALHLRCEKFLSGVQGNIISHYIWVLRKCCIEKSTLHFGAKPFLKGVKMHYSE